LKIDELVKTIFSRKDAKNAKKNSFNSNQFTSRSLRLGVSFLNSIGDWVAGMGLR